MWPRYAHPSKPDSGQQYAGWPKTIGQLDNYGRKAVAYLPTLHITGMTNPIVQVIDERDGTVVYTLRIRGNRFRPKVFAEGTYTIKVGDQEAGRMKTLPHVRALPPEQEVPPSIVSF